MGQVLNDILRNFSGGVVTSKPADELDINESPRGRNSALYLVAGQKALVQKRKGASVVNATPIMGAPAILGQYPFRLFSGPTYTLYHLCVSDNGRLDVMSSLGTPAAADSANPAPFTSGTHIPDFATSNNLAFIVNRNGDKKKFNGTSVQNFGIDRPTVGTMALADSGSLGVHNGTYEARLTYYNANTGQESSISDSTAATLAVTNKIINWSNIPVSSDTQVTARRLYIRNTATMTNFYLAKTLSDNTSTTTTTNVSDASLVSLGPDTAENDPPPANVKYLATHLSRLFASDGVSVFYSKVGLPESFDPDNTEEVNANDSDQITGLHAAHEFLIIFKRTQMYALFGDDPASWTIRQISADIGCVSHRSVRTIEGITYWWSLKGPIKWDGVGLPEAIGTPKINPTIDSAALAYGEFSNLCAEVDQQNQRVMFAVPEFNKTRNTLILPFNYRLAVWESDGWNPFDVASMAAVEDTNKIPWVMVGSYSGQVFKWWNASNDAIPIQSTTTGTATSATSTTLTDTVATFAIVGAGLIDRYVYITDPTNTNTQRIRIVSNTATVLTIDSATPIFGDVTGYTYIVGGPDFAWDTPWMDGLQPFFKKRFEYLYIQAYSTTGNISVTVDFFLDYDNFTVAKTAAFTTTSTGAVWDTSLWDSPTTPWGYALTRQIRTRIGKTGRYWRARFRNAQPDQEVILAKVGMRSELLTDKS